MFKRSVLLLLAFLAIGPGSAQAAADPRSVTVEVDSEAARLVQLYGIEAAANAALQAYRGIDIQNGYDGVTVTVAGPADAEKLDRAIRGRVEGRPGATVARQRGILLVAQLTPEAWAKRSTYERGKVAHQLEQLLPTARPRIVGIQIESAPNGAVVRTSDPDLKARLPKMIDEAFRQTAEVRPQGEGAWFVRIKEIPDVKGIGEGGGIGPSFVRSPEAKARNAELVARMNREMAVAVELLLREPIDLEAASEPFSEDGPTRTRLFLDQGHIDRASIEEARTLIAQAGGVLKEEPAEQISINMKTPRPDPYAPADTTLFNEISDLIDPPVNMVEQGDGVLVRAVDPARNRERATLLRQAFAGRSDLVLSDQADGSLRIEPAPSARIGSGLGGRVMDGVRARLRTLKLSPSSLSPAGEGRARATFATAEDAAVFRQNLQAGGEAFAVRLVDGDPYGPVSETPPTPGDLRKPLSEGGFVWVRPQALITGAMLEPSAAAAVTDPDRNDMPVVTFSFGSEGRRAFAAITGSHIGQMFAVMSDGVVIEAPTINDAITGGSGQIINPTEAQADALVARMNAASDDLPLKLVEETGG